MGQMGVMKPTELWKVKHGGRVEGNCALIAAFHSKPFIFRVAVRVLCSITGKHNSFHLHRKTISKLHLI